LDIRYASRRRHQQPGERAFRHDAQSGKGVVWGSDEQSQTYRSGGGEQNDIWKALTELEENIVDLGTRSRMKAQLAQEGVHRVVHWRMQRGRGGESWAEQAVVAGCASGRVGYKLAMRKPGAAHQAPKV